MITVVRMVLVVVATRWWREARGQSRSGGEEGEEDFDNDLAAHNLSEEQLEELRKKGISIEDYLNA